MMRTKSTHCRRHDQPRPCRECAALGWGGSRGGGRPKELEHPVRIKVNLERREAEFIAKCFPARSRSAALRSSALAGAGLARPLEGPADAKPGGTWSKAATFLRRLATIDAPELADHLLETLDDALRDLTPHELAVELELARVKHLLGGLTETEERQVRSECLEPTPCPHIPAAIEQLPDFALYITPPREISRQPARRVELSYAQAHRLMRIIRRARQGPPSGVRISWIKPEIEALGEIRLPENPPEGASISDRIELEISSADCYRFYAAAREYLLASEQELERAWAFRCRERSIRGEEAVAKALYRKFIHDPPQCRLLKALQKIPVPDPADYDGWS